MTPRVPLLTQKEAQSLLVVLGEGPLREGCLVPPVQALADGRTACVERLTQSAHYERWRNDMGCGDDDWPGYLACAHANGLVKP